jgi:hypothetical protein
MNAIDEKKLRKHGTRMARIKDMHNGILQLCGRCQEKAVA